MDFYFYLIKVTNVTESLTNRYQDRDQLAIEIENSELSNENKLVLFVKLCDVERTKHYIQTTKFNPLVLDPISNLIRSRDLGHFVDAFAKIIEIVLNHKYIVSESTLISIIIELSRLQRTHPYAYEIYESKGMSNKIIDRIMNIYRMSLTPIPHPSTIVLSISTRFYNDHYKYIIMHMSKLCVIEKLENRLLLSDNPQVKCNVKYTSKFLLN